MPSLIGNKPNQVPTNGDLGTLAFQDSNAVNITGGTASLSSLTNTGVTTVQAGTVSAPAITTSGDTNTGIFFPAADTIAFTEGGAEAMRIDSSGRVGIGTSSPSGRLHIRDSAIFRAAMDYVSNTYEAVYTETNTGGSGTYPFDVNGHLVIQPRTSTGNARDIVFATGSNTPSTRMVINSSGNVGIGLTPTSRNNTRLQIVDGIGFPATQVASTDANTLDDYEEGTFTPTAYGATTAGTTTYLSAQYGYYTKIGRQVTITISLAWSAMTGTGTLVIGGLPFTQANLTDYYSVGAVLPSDLNWTGGTSLVALSVPNTTTLNLYGMSDDGAATAQACVNETANIRVTLTYFV
jgi:hypothetical protein